MNLPASLFPKSKAQLNREKYAANATSIYGSPAFKSQCDKVHAWNMNILRKARKLREQHDPHDPLEQGDNLGLSPDC